MAKQLSESLKEAHAVIKSSADNLLKQGQHEILVEVKFINYRTYGGYQFVKATGDGDQEIQLVMPAELIKQLDIKPKNTYAMTGCFEVTRTPEFGFLQFKVSAAAQVGQSFAVETKKQAASEIVEQGYLNKYKSDFEDVKGKQRLHVAVVTSPSSQVIEDMEHVFKKRPGIIHEVIGVKLNDAESIAEGIRRAAAGSYDIVAIVRGGGGESQFNVFDDPCVAKAIYETRKPVVTGIGHSGNHTFADRIADRAETTPTKAATFIADLMSGVVVPLAAKQTQQNQAKQYGNRSNYYGKKKKKAAASGCAVLVFVPLVIILTGIILSVS